MHTCIRVLNLRTICLKGIGIAGGNTAPPPPDNPPKDESSEAGVLSKW